MEHGANMNNSTTAEQQVESVAKNRASYISAFFPAPECFSVRYDEDEALSYVTPFKQADKITSWMTKLVMKNSNEKILNIVIEATGGLGGNLLSFARSKFIEQVLGFEINSKRFEALQHNVQLYQQESAKINVQHMNFADWWFETQKSIGQSRSEIFENSAIKTAAVFIDPPWGGQDYKSFSTIEDLPLFTETDPNAKSKQNYEQVDGKFSIGMHKLLLDLFEQPKVVIVVLKLPYNFSRKNFPSHLNVDIFEIKKVTYFAFMREHSSRSLKYEKPSKTFEDRKRYRKNFENDSSSKDSYAQESSLKRQRF